MKTDIYTKIINLIEAIRFSNYPQASSLCFKLERKGYGKVIWRQLCNITFDSIGVLCSLAPLVVTNNYYLWLDILNAVQCTEQNSATVPRAREVLEYTVHFLCICPKTSLSLEFTLYGLLATASNPHVFKIRGEEDAQLYVFHFDRIMQRICNGELWRDDLFHTFRHFLLFGNEGAFVGIYVSCVILFEFLCGTDSEIDRHSSSELYKLAKISAVVYESLSIFNDPKNQYETPDFNPFPSLFYFLSIIYRDRFGFTSSLPNNIIMELLHLDFNNLADSRLIFSQAVLLTYFSLTPGLDFQVCAPDFFKYSSVMNSHQLEIAFSILKEHLPLQLQQHICGVKTRSCFYETCVEEMHSNSSVFFDYNCYFDAESIRQPVLSISTFLNGRLGIREFSFLAPNSVTKEFLDGQNFNIYDSAPYGISDLSSMTKKHFRTFASSFSFNCDNVNLFTIASKFRDLLTPWLKIIQEKSDTQNLYIYEETE